MDKIEIMWKYEQEFRIDKPETEGETDKHFDLDNYKDWLEEQLTDCRKQLSIQRVSNQRELLIDCVRTCLKDNDSVTVEQQVDTYLLNKGN
jgi:hypothetical protein